MKIDLSELDEKRFGVKIAKATLSVGDDVNAAIEWCNINNVKMLIARCLCEDIKLIQELEASGGRLMDTLAYYKNTKMVKMEKNLDTPYSWRFATEGDADLVEKLAGEIFNGYGGHYHADSKLKKEDSDRVYSSWARNSCYGEPFSDVMFLILRGDQIIGFLVVKKIDSHTCDIVLNGISPDYQKGGLYSFLISLAKNWALDQGIEKIVISTQITNVSVQKVWCRQGFEPFSSFYTFHKWFN